MHAIWKCLLTPTNKELGKYNYIDAQTRMSVFGPKYESECLPAWIMKSLEQKL